MPDSASTTGSVTASPWKSRSPQTGDADGGATYLLEGPADGDTLDMASTTHFEQLNVPASDKVLTVPSNVIPYFTFGGARIVVTPYQQAGETPHEETGVLVGDMYQAFLMPGKPKGIQPWENEGYANPTGRLASEDDVAQVVAFLASAANNSVTGAEIHVGRGA